MTGYQIAEAARRTGFTPTALRFYERAGLVPTVRTPAGYRIYTDDDLDRLRFIGRAKRLGLPLGDIRELVRAWDAGLCQTVKERLDALLTARSVDVAARVAELHAFDEALARARQALAGPTPAGRCDDSCGCVGDAAAIVTPSTWPAQAGPAAVACTLTGAAQQDRAGDWAELLRLASATATVDGGVDITFPAEPAVIARVVTLAVAEQLCCSFFRFSLDVEGSGVLFRVRAPIEAGPVVDALFAT